MLRVRVMPCLLVRHGALVKTIGFKQPSYVGDPVNAVHIFNEKEVDELILLDIGATPEGTPPAFDVIARVTTEAFMPLAYGGGLRTLDDVKRVLNLGIEKVVINTQAFERPAFVTEVAAEYGSQAVIVSVDARRRKGSGHEVYTKGGSLATGFDPAEYAARMEKIGAGEIMITSIERDGTMQGYDLDLIRSVSAATQLPVIASGGAGSVADFGRAVREGAAACAAGAMVVYYGRNRAVLINFPDRRELDAVLP
jgi:imidazole glycerol-phosphate synthase subunit HisF